MNLLAEHGHLWLFAVLVIGIIALPGMDMALVMAKAMSGGRAHGLAATGGVMAGGAVHTLVAVVGLGVLLRLYPLAYQALLVAGTLYMAWIGWSLLRAGSLLGDDIRRPAGTLARSGRQGLLTCLLNPKAYLFMLAVFPQFLRPAQGALWVQALAMGLIILAAQALIYGGVSLAAHPLRQWLGRHPRGQQWAARAVGGLLIGMAAWALWNNWAMPSA